MGEGRQSALEKFGALGSELEALRLGAGAPLLLLHGFDTVEAQAPFLGLLARHNAILAPSLPGFGRSPRPQDFDTVYDLVHLVLDLIEGLPSEKVSLVGFSFGGWLAAEAAVKCPHRLDKLVLVDPLGVKFGGRESRDVLDIFNVHPDEVRRAGWHDPDRFAPDYDAMTDEEIVIRAKNREALCLYAWHPYMYNPQLPRWLKRIAVPTLVLWGASDGVVSPEYGRQYARLIPGARFEMFERAGHHPEIEQPEAFANCVAAFLEE
jgi:pimeloyl-ACP methyl ester carboxylesterase